MEYVYFSIAWLLPFAGIGIGVLLFRNYSIKTHTVAVKGIITDIHSETTTIGERIDEISSTQTGYYPTYKYTYNGQEYTVDEAVGQSPKKVDIGKEVTMYVNPNKPSDAITDVFKRRMLILAYVLIGIGFLGLFTYVFTKK